MPSNTVPRRTQGYEFLQTPFQLDFVAQAAYRLDDKREFTKQVQLYTRRKLDTVLSAAAKDGYTALVLSAMGCGAFRNPPKQVAQIFRDVLSGFYDVFDTVVFAVLDVSGRLESSNINSDCTHKKLQARTHTQVDGTFFLGYLTRYPSGPQQQRQSRCI